MSVSIPEKELIFPKYYTCCFCPKFETSQTFRCQQYWELLRPFATSFRGKFNLIVATSLYRFAQLVLFHVEKTFKKNLWDKGIQQATSKTLKLNQLIFPNYFAILLLVPFPFRLNVPPLTNTALHIM